jgi:murein DD-endopeptidase MepM/ murein hydrolase activator NlpD
LLPFPAGRTFLVCQGNRGVVSHRDWEEFAYDFAMPVGSDVCAARGGVVIHVVDKNDGNGRHALNNRIDIDHGDGTIGKYLHIKRGGSYVRVGERVARGQRIAASGHVGLSMLPHLHFVVDDRLGNSLPIRFADVESDGGIPRMFKRYTSSNILAQP